VAKRVRALVVTRGAEGSVIHADGRRSRFRARPEPWWIHGLRDAYRAG